MYVHSAFIIWLLSWKEFWIICLTFHYNLSYHITSKQLKNLFNAIKKLTPKNSTLLTSNIHLHVSNNVSTAKPWSYLQQSWWYVPYLINHDSCVCMYGDKSPTIHLLQSTQHDSKFTVKLPLSTAYLFQSMCLINFTYTHSLQAHTHSFTGWSSNSLTHREW